jgi:hypothetical protein
VRPGIQSGPRKFLGSNLYEFSSFYACGVSPSSSTVYSSMPKLFCDVTLDLGEPDLSTLEMVRLVVDLPGLEGRRARFDAGIAHALALEWVKGDVVVLEGQAGCCGRTRGPRWQGFRLPWPSLVALSCRSGLGFGSFWAPCQCHFGENSEMASSIQGLK